MSDSQLLNPQFASHFAEAGANQLAGARCFQSFVDNNESSARDRFDKM